MEAFFGESSFGNRYGKRRGDLFLQLVRTFLQNVLPETEVDWVLVSQNDFDNVKDLLDRVEEHRPDLVVTYGI